MKQESWIQFAAAVNEKTIGKLLQVLAEQVNAGIRSFHICISSPGGSIHHGMTAYHALQSLPIQVETYNIGRVDSIGLIIFLASDKRYFVPNSAFLIHSVGMTLPASASPHFIEEKSLTEKLESLKKDRANVATLISQRTGIKLEEVEEMMLKGVTLNAAEAIERGIAADTAMPQIPEGAKVITITDAA